MRIIVSSLFLRSFFDDFFNIDFGNLGTDCSTDLDGIPADPVPEAVGAVVLGLHILTGVSGLGSCNLGGEAGGPVEPGSGFLAVGPEVLGAGSLVVAAVGLQAAVGG